MKAKSFPVSFLQLVSCFDNTVVSLFSDCKSFVDSIDVTIYVQSYVNGINSIGEHSWKIIQDFVADKYLTSVDEYGFGKAKLEVINETIIFSYNFFHYGANSVAKEDAKQFIENLQASVLDISMLFEGLGSVAFAYPDEMKSGSKIIVEQILQEASFMWGDEVLV